jgi:hypothetical protein
VLSQTGGIETGTASLGVFRRGEMLPSLQYLGPEGRHILVNGFLDHAMKSHDMLFRGPGLYIGADYLINCF